MNYDNSLKNVDLNQLVKELLPYIDTSIYIDPLRAIRISHGLKDELIIEANSMIVTDSKFFDHPVIKRYPYVFKGLFTVLNLTLENLNGFPYKIEVLSIDSCIVKSFSGTIKSVESLFCFKSKGFQNLKNIFIVTRSIHFSELDDLTSLKGIEKSSLSGSLKLEKCYNIRTIDYLPKITELLVIEKTFVQKIKVNLSLLLAGNISLYQNAFSEKEIFKIQSQVQQDFSLDDTNKVILSQNEGRKLLIIKDQL